MKRRSLWLTIACVMTGALILSACGGKKEDKTDKEVIRLMSGGAGYWEDSLNPVIEAYNKSQETVEVVVDYYQYDALLSNIEVKFGSKSEDYDMITVDAPLVAAYSNRGYIAPLDDYFSQNELDEFVESEKESSYWKDNFMAAPMSNSSQILWYNAELLEDAGLECPGVRPEDRMSWEEIVNMAEKAQKVADPDGTEGIMGLMFEQVDRAYQMLALPNSFGEASIGKDGYRVDGILDSEGWIKSLEFYKSLYDKGISARGVTAEEVTGYFTSGKVVFMIGATWTGANAEAAGINYGYTPCPYFEGYENQVATPTGSWHVGISSFSSKKEACADFLKYLTIGDGQAWNQVAGNVPSTFTGIKATTSGEFSAMTLAAYEAENTAVPRPVTPGYSEYETIINQLFSDVRNGAEIKTSVESAIQSINDSMKKYQD